jgi:hypothetical protein
MYIPSCLPVIVPIQTQHRNYVQDTQKCVGQIRTLIYTAKWDGVITSRTQDT